MFGRRLKLLLFFNLWAPLAFIRHNWLNEIFHLILRILWRLISIRYNFIRCEVVIDPEVRQGTLPRLYLLGGLQVCIQTGMVFFIRWFIINKPRILVLLSNHCLNILRMAIWLINIIIACTLIDGLKFLVLQITTFFKLLIYLLFCAISHYVSESCHLHAPFAAASHFR